MLSGKKKKIINYGSPFPTLNKKIKQGNCDFLSHNSDFFSHNCEIWHKMAPQMAATVLCSSVFVLVLFVFPVFCFSNMVSFTRDELLNIRQNTPHNLLPDFDYSDALLDIIVGGAAVLFRRYRTRRRGKRAGRL